MRAIDRLSLTSAVVGLLFGSHAAIAASDLVVQEVDGSGLSFVCPTAGVSGTVAATVRNLGDTATGAGFNVQFFQDENANGQYDSGIDLALGVSTVPGSLAPGGQVIATAAISDFLKFSKNLIFAFADSDDQLAEASESNNVSDTGKSCAFAPTVGTFDPVIEWAWTSSLVEPAALNVMMTPAVVDLNSDGVPDVVFGSTASVGGGYVEVGFLRALRGDTGAELFTVTDPTLRVNTATSVAVGDIDNDGLPEIIACAASGNQIIAFENNGAFKWISPALSAINWGAPAIADLDQDGTPEIVIGRYALNNDGTIRWTGTGGQGGPFGPIALVADVDDDGSPDVVGGNTVYSAAGAILWQNTALPDGLDAVANFDGDTSAEIVLVGSGFVWLLENDCTVKWGPVAIPGGGVGGPPTVADYDGDGSPEIGVAGASDYTVFESDGTVKWSSPTQDGSSNVTGSSVFDFDGDGSAEVVYRDELYLRVYRGSDGTVLFQTPMSSCTWHEYVLVADVDADGNAEIVAVANTNCGYGPQQGVYVLGDANDSWVATRKVWNEHAYHITNVNEDGTIPQFEQTNWLYPPSQPYNNYRQNTLPGSEPLAAPNLTASLVRLDTAPCPEGVRIVARIGNGGSNVAAAPVSVAFYDGDPGLGGPLIGTAPTSVNLVPGTYEEVSLLVTPPPAAPSTYWVVADDSGSGVGALSECDETDNACSVDVAAYPCGATPILLLNASVVQRGAAVELQWSASTDVAIAEYRIWRSLETVAGERLIANLLSSPDGRQSYRDETVQPLETYVYRIEAMDGAGESHSLGRWSVTIGRGPLGSVFRASPNPARTNVAIAFENPANQAVELAILDAEGRIVRSYRVAALAPGRQTLSWDLKDATGQRVAAGMYAYRLSAGRVQGTGKVAVLQP